MVKLITHALIRPSLTHSLTRLLANSLTYSALTLSDGIVLLNFCVITAPPLLLTTAGVVTMAAFTVEPAAPMTPTAETEPVLEQQDDDEPDEQTDKSV